MSDNPFTELRAELQTVVERHVGALAGECEDAFTLPVAADWLLLVGIDDMDGSGSTVAEVHSPGPEWAKLGLAHRYLQGNS